MTFGSSPFGSSPFGSSPLDDSSPTVSSDNSDISRARVQNLENFFWKSPYFDSNFFDEAKETTKGLRLENSSQISTTDIDGYRQGIEITSWKHFDAGTVKIHAGEEGHRLKQQIFGLNHVYYSSKAFNDGGGIDPVRFIGSINPPNRQVTAQPFISVPPPTELSSLEFEKYLYDGVIDFLGARRRDVMLRTNTPVDTRGVRGEIQDGNIDEAGGTNQVVSIYKRDIQVNRERPFFDDPLLLDRRWASNISTTIMLTGSRLSMFDDARLLRNAQTSSISYDDTMTSALSLMTGSTENFVSIKECSATSGWDYDNNSVTGTDSIAFGGLAY